MGQDRARGIDAGHQSTPDDVFLLVERARGGDAMAMHNLLLRVEPLVGAWCMPIALDDGLDATQEAMITIFRRLGDLREPRAFHGWVRRISVRAAVKTARERSKVPLTSEDWLEEVPSADDPAVRIDILSVMQQLSPEQRAVLTLRVTDGLSDEEIATALGIPRGTVRSRLSRARTRFRKEWLR